MIGISPWLPSLSDGSSGSLSPKCEICADENETQKQDGQEYET